MARLPRVKQKIFAGTAAANQITAFGTIKSGTPSYTTSAADIMNANFEAGWSSAIEGDYAPYRQDRNAVDTATTQQLAYIFQEGVAEWDYNTTYYNGSVAKLIDGTTVKFYRSIADNNTSTLNDTTKWALFLNISNTGVFSAPTIDNLTTTGTITTPITANRAVVTNGSKQLIASSVTSTEIGYVSGVTSAIQTQLNAKFNAANLQVVSSLPANPDSDTWYGIPEE